VKILLEAGADV